MYVVQIYDNFDSYVCETTNDLCFVVCGLCCGKKKERVIKNLRSSNLLLIEDKKFQVFVKLKVVRDRCA